MDYRCAEFGDFSFSRFGFYCADKQNHTHTRTHTYRQTGRITEADQHYTYATTVSLSKKYKNCIAVCNIQCCRA